MKSTFRFLVAFALAALSLHSNAQLQYSPQSVRTPPAQLVAPQSSPKDPLTNPDAVKHHIDRSAMEVRIQG